MLSVTQLREMDKNKGRGFTPKILLNKHFQLITQFHELTERFTHCQFLKRIADKKEGGVENPRNALSSKIT
jgi:hypothetical protein